MKAKLSKAQQKIMEDARKDIDKARNAEDIVEWYRACTSASWIKEMPHDELAEEFKKHDSRGWWKDTYEGLLQGIVYTHANGRSLYRLQELGLIEIIDDQTGHWMYDTVKILNY